MYKSFHIYIRISKRYKGTHSYIGVFMSTHVWRERLLGASHLSHDPPEGEERERGRTEFPPPALSEGEG